MKIVLKTGKVLELTLEELIELGGVAVPAFIAPAQPQTPPYPATDPYPRPPFEVTC